MTARHLKDVLDAEVAAGPKLLIVDLSRLTFMDSWARHVSLAGQGLRAAGGAPALAGPTGEVRRILELTGADTLVTVHASVQDASRRQTRARTPGKSARSKAPKDTSRARQQAR